jgi:putative SOS response-associated peptidase YedK
MCGRFAQASAIQKVQEMLNIVGQLDLTPRYNVAPSIPIIAIRENTDAAMEWATFHWGLIPHWAKDKKIGYKMINAKAETVHEKPSFRNAFKYRRCVIPADGFYEWRNGPNGKQPYYILAQNDEPLFFAGLWESWTSPEESIESCTIITTEATGNIREIHTRMPVTLTGEQITQWVDRDIQDPVKLHNLLTPTAKLNYYPVAKTVNNPRNDTPECIEPLEPKE